VLQWTCAGLGSGGGYKEGSTERRIFLNFCFFGEMLGNFPGDGGCFSVLEISLGRHESVWSSQRVSIGRIF
jgi:hypothetical protein